MKNQDGAWTIAEELDTNIRGRRLQSFLEVLQFLESRDTQARLDLVGAFSVGSKEKNALKILPQTLAENNTLKQIYFSYFEVHKIQVAKAIAAILRKSEVVLMIFENMEVPKRFLKLIAQAFRERSTPAQLKLEGGSPKFVQEMIDASCLKCFSLTLLRLEWKKAFKQPIRNLVLRGTLSYLSIEHVTGLTEKAYNELARCIVFLPGLKKLHLRSTPVPVSALMRLIASLKALTRENLTTLEVLHLGGTRFDEYMAYSCFTLFELDKMSRLHCTAKNNKFSPLITKYISTMAERSKHLKYLSFGSTLFNPETKFDSFILSQPGFKFNAPFKIKRDNLRGTTI